MLLAQWLLGGRMSEDPAAILLGLIDELVANSPEFGPVKGPGKGNVATNALMRDLRHAATRTFGVDHSEQKICGDNTSLAVDFYFSKAATVVEVALGLGNPATEFEKDILKALMAKELGHAVQRLVLISRPGAGKKCRQPGRRAIIEWVRQKHDVAIDVREIAGEPRPRRQRRKIAVASTTS